MLTRPHIPVRDGLHMARWRPLRPAPELGQVEYVNGWRWGMVCGTVFGATLVGVVGVVVR
jgi:hypothetical protein